MNTPGPQLIFDTKRREGFSAAVYADSKGLPTQGYGQHDGVCFGDPDVDEATAEHWLINRLVVATNDARNLLGSQTFDALDQVRRDSFTDLAYNMGFRTLSLFVPMIAAMRAGQWHSAADHLLVNSHQHLTPYLLDVGARAVENALRIATGRILPEQLVV